LIVIYAKPARFEPIEDCCMAGQNLLLAAHAMGLGTCPVGFARPWFNEPEIKLELGIPANYTAVLPIVVGWPAGPTIAPPRAAPEIISWGEDPAERETDPFP
jgi:nitroreductase